MLSVEESNQRIDALLSQWRSNFIPLAESVNFIRGEMSLRIFGSKGSAGKNTAGTTLPTTPYSSTPIYVDVRSLPNTPSSFQVGKRGTKIKSAYFPQGYGQLKNVVDRPPLELTGNLFKGFSNLPILAAGEDVSIEIPTDQARKVNGLEKGKGNFKGYGTIFQMSKEEEKEFELVLAEQIAEAINKALE